MKQFISLSGYPLVNIKKVHHISTEDVSLRTPDGVFEYVYKIKFTFAANRTFIWNYRGIGAPAGALAQDSRDHDYALLNNFLNITK